MKGNGCLYNLILWIVFILAFGLFPTLIILPLIYLFCAYIDTYYAVKDSPDGKVLTNFDILYCKWARRINH